MCRQRVAVLYTHPLFGRGIARLLAEDPALEVASSLLGAASAPVAPITPAVDAVIMEAEDRSLVEQLIQALPPVLIVVVRLRDNEMEVYRDRRPFSPPRDNLLDITRDFLSTRAVPGRALPSPF